VVLGEKIGEMTGKVTTTRVLPGDDYRYVKMEITVQESGQIYGTNATNIGTYVVFERVPGQIYGQGQGFLATSDGEGAIWNGHGVAKAAGMAMSFAFSVAFQAGGTGTLSKLKDVLVIGEHQADPEGGNTKTVFWEWKA
jgi:hypothetical protein